MPARRTVSAPWRAASISRWSAQAEPDKVAPEELIVEGALFGSGRPVVVVPYIQKSGLKLDRVMVCWDASRNAARAVADAMPFLARAKAIDVVIVASERPKSDEIPGADIGQHLARHGLKVEVKRIVATDTDVANTILSHAADSSADFIVMGGYGHSRLREFILGGATRGILVVDDGAGADVALTFARGRPHLGRWSRPRTRSTHHDVLPDGTRVLMRPLRPEDAALYPEFHRARDAGGFAAALLRGDQGAVGRAHRRAHASRLRARDGFHRDRRGDRAGCSASCGCISTTTARAANTP